MRIALYSDLHLEYQSWVPPRLDADVVILAGDIAVHTAGLEWAAAETFAHAKSSPTVLYVAGNHEYYDADIGQMASEMRERARALGITFLDNEAIEIQGVRFLGTTLWTDFALYGSKTWTERSMQMAVSSIRDYALIRENGAPISPSGTVVLHRKAVDWLGKMLREPFAGKTVVVSHFAPHPRCVAPRYEADVLTPYFVVNMAPLMLHHAIDIWAFGHTHHNVDFVTENGCRVISNQRGYPTEARSSASGFRPELIIDI